MPSKAESVIRRYTDLKTARLPFESEWGTLADYCHLGRQLTFSGGVAGSVLTSKVFDSLSFVAPQILAASLHANLTNPSTRWSRVQLRQDDLRDLDEVQDWSDDCSMKQDRARAASNFTSAAGAAYLELPIFGTSPLLIDGKPPVRSLRWAKMPGGGMRPTGEQVFAGFLYTAVPIGTYVIAEGRDGRVDTLIREVKKSITAWAQEFGEARLPDTLQKLLARKPDELVPLLHAVYPRSTDPEKYTAEDLPFASDWIYEPEKFLVFSSGYHSFPYACPRWLKATGEVYGRGQGHLALPDIKVLNERVEIRQWDWKMRLAPPIFERPGAVRGDLQWAPGKRNFANSKDDVWTVHQPSSIQEALEQENRLEAKIRATFFVDQIMALPSPADDKIGGMSPYEVARRMEQVFRVLGPVYGNLEPEWLKAIAEREFDLMWRGGAFEPPPAVLLQRPDADLDFVFDSPMSRAQRADDASAVEQAIATTAQVVQYTSDPAAWDNLDLDLGLRTIYEIRGVPAKVLRGGDAVAQLRATRQEAQVTQMQQQDALAGSEVAKNVAPLVKAMQAPPQQAAA